MSASGVADNPILVGRDAVLSGEQFLAFQRILVPSFSRSFRPNIANDHSAFEMLGNTCVKTHCHFLEE